MALLKASNGKIRGLVAFKTPAEAYELTTTEGLDADVFAALPKAQQLGDWATDTLRAPIFSLVEGYGYAGDPAAPIAIALVSWILGKNGRRIDETSKLVALLQEEITRLTAKVEKLEAKVEIKEHESERKSGIIQEAFRCKTPSHKCPVLIKLFEFNDQKEDEQRTKKLQPGEYPPECDQIQGRDEEFRPGL